MTAIHHITVPAGFVSAGVKCGVKASGKHDLAIIAGLADCSAAVVTTQNQVVGEPVKYCRKTLPKGYGTVRGVVINSGCANVCTGVQGCKDAAEMASRTALRLGVDAKHILVASTGIIGHPLPMNNIRHGIDRAAATLGGAAGDSQELSK